MMWRTLAFALLFVSLSPATRAWAAPAGSAAIPVLAYDYIWFNHASWNRAKADYPLLGRYSSDDVAVMRRQMQWAQAAGIDGFIVSWKSTPSLNRRLARLIAVADTRHFALAIEYEGLDFHRRPLPAARVAADLDGFIHRFARDRAFNLFGKPLVIWSGTWKFSAAAIAAVTTPRRSHLLILASERNPRDYLRLVSGGRSSVDGDAYYWSSVNPATYPGYGAKLTAMAAAVHRAGGLWIAPAAPGFDGRLTGGHTVVPRADGATLRTELDAALASSPDAVGLISWNEFSEGSYLEPSRRYGDRYLRVLSALLHAPGPTIADFDSSDPGTTGGTSIGLPILGGLAGMTCLAVFVVLRRRPRASVNGRPPDPPAEEDRAG